MIRRILVPLDGTDLAEAALPVAAALCVKLGAEVVLVHLLEKRAPRAVHGRPHLATAGAAEAYLNQIAARRCLPVSSAALRTAAVPRWARTTATIISGMCAVRKKRKGSCIASEPRSA